MKFQKLFLGSLVLAVPFTACTNEDLMDSVPTTPEAALKNAVSLGDDFSIVGVKTATNSRFVFDTDFDGVWEKTDTVGGAWFAYTTDGGQSGNLIQAGYFYSNHPFAFNKDLGGMKTVEFKAPTNAFAGKYVLYYPYNYKVTSVNEAIPVEFEQNPTMDCTAGKEMDHVNKNIFAWCTTEFKAGGPQAGEFTLNQAGNVVVIKIGSTEGNIDRIQNKEISKIILESSDKLVCKATIDNEGEDYSKAVGKYIAGTEVSTYILSPINATADYQVTAAGEDGMTKKPFYMSMLPAKSDISELIVKVILKDGRVYEKNLTKAANADIFAKLVKSGQKIELNVLLDTESSSTGVYTVEQFNEALANATEANNSIELSADIELPSLSFNKRGKSVSITGKKLTVAGDVAVTDGNLTIENLDAEGAVKVGEYGNLTVNTLESAGAITVDGKATITGSTTEIASVEVTKAAALTLSTATVKGNMTIGRAAEVSLSSVTLKGNTNSTAGNITISGASSNNGTFTATEGTIETTTAALNNNASMTLTTVTVSGNNGINNNAGATLNIKGEAATIGKITNAVATTGTDVKPAAELVVELSAADKELTITDLEQNGNMTVKKGKVKESASNNFGFGANSLTTLAADAVLTLDGSSDGTNSTTGAKIIVVNANNISDKTNLGTNKVSVATEITDASKLSSTVSGLSDTVDEFVINAANAVIASGDVANIQSHILTLKKSVKLGASASLTMTKPLNVEGDVTISAETASTTVTLCDKTTGENTINGKLTVGENVTLAGNESGSKIVLVNGSTVKAGEGGNFNQTDITFELK